MSRRSKKLRLWNSLRFRVTAGMILTVTLGAALLCVAVERQLDRGMEQRITDESMALRLNAEIYARQILMMRGENNDAQGMEHCVQELLSELTRTGKENLCLYTVEGTLIGAQEQKKTARSSGEWEKRSWAQQAQGGQKEAFANALGGQAAYTIVYGSGDGCDVYFASPLEVAGKTVGILTSVMDYSGMRAENRQTLTMMVKIVGGIYLLSGCVVFLLLMSVTNPLRALSRLSGRISREMRREETDGLGRLENTRLLRRRDEIGELARNYDQMLRTIERQFGRIRSDRDSIRALMESRQEFYNNVTHELKTPLTTIQGYAQLLESSGLEDSELFQRGIAHVLHESTRLHRMVVQLLEMAERGPASRMEPVDLGALAQSVAAAMELKAGRYGNTLVVEGERQLLVRGREDRLRQLLINLTDNAIKYGYQGSEIRIRLRKEGLLAAVGVENQGDGIPEQDLEAVFEPFFRMDKERSREMGSAGLGLSICRKIAEEHGGTVSVESVRGGTTVFWFRMKQGKAQGPKEQERTDKRSG